MDKPECPHCGDSEHLYIKADLKWDADTQRWEADAVEETVECTSCDETFYYGEANLPHPDIEVTEPTEEAEEPPIAVGWPGM